MDRASLNEAGKLAYRDPEVALRELRAIELIAVASEISPQVKHLRTNDLKGSREYRQAALFCLGMSVRIERAVRFCPVEASDYDFIATWESEEDLSQGWVEENRAQGPEGAYVLLKKSEAYPRVQRGPSGRCATLGRLTRTFMYLKFKGGHTCLCSSIVP